MTAVAVLRYSKKKKIKSLNPHTLSTRAIFALFLLHIEKIDPPRLQYGATQTTITESLHPYPQLHEAPSSYKSATSAEIKGIQLGQSLANPTKINGTPSLLPFQIQRLSDICTSAAKIIKGFARNGKISQDKIRQAQGLVVFKGWQIAAGSAISCGSGIVLIRRPNGTWSPPYAISVKSCGGGVAYGLGLYDCIHILDTDDAIKDLIKGEWKFSSQLTAVFGPFGATRPLKERQNTSEHTRSCGLYFGITTSSIKVKGKEDQNTDIYGLGLSVGELLWEYPVTDEIKNGMQSVLDVLKQLQL